MSNKREPLLSDEQLDEICEVHPYSAQLYAKRSAIAVNTIHEAARANDAELIQQLVDALEANSGYGGPPISASMLADYALIAAADAGFKPSDE